GISKRLVAPGQLLERVNPGLYPDFPPKMFVTCLHALPDPDNGHLQFANAGHDLPYHRHTTGQVTELRATGMPLGMMPGMHYDEKEVWLASGEVILLHSDRIVGARHEHRDTVRSPRLSRRVSSHEAAKTCKD